MFALLVALTLFAQGTPTMLSDNGTIAGVLKTSGGTPVAGVRVAAMAIPESALAAITGAAMVSLAATDEAGRYRLENIPPGRYYITAGRVDFPTYFPGALDMSAGTIVSVTSKATIADLNFAVQDASIRSAATDSLMLSPQPALSIPILVRVESGGKQPVSANGYYVTLGLTRTLGGPGINIPLNGPAFSAPISSAVVGAEYRVTVDNLPDGYVLKSISFGSTNLMTDTLKLTAANFLQLSIGPTLILPVSTTVPSGVSSNAISINLAMVPTSAPSLPGVRVRGRAPVTAGNWMVYRGDVPGTFYADGSFELNGVPRGQHIVLLEDDSRPQRFYAAVLNVGDRDLDGVAVESIGSILPVSFVLPPGTNSPASGGSQPLAGLLGNVAEEDGRTPVSQGSVTVLGRTLTTIPIGKDGQFVIPHLLPGSYDLRLESYEHFTLYKTVVVADQDTRADFVMRSNLATPEELATSQAEQPR